MPGLSEQIAPLIPFLRRYARALTGCQQTGDAYVAATLESIVTAPQDFPPLDARLGLYRTFHLIWESVPLNQPPATEAPTPERAEEVTARRLARLTPLNRQALLLSVIEGFSPQEVATILGLENDQTVNELVTQAVRDIDRQTQTSVLIIEDEAVIALDLRQIVTSLGHRVLDVAPTRDAAVRTARDHHPGLVLADIQLADGSSGIDAARDIVTGFAVPIIFITAYPERLLTGRKLEPTFLITKPYHPEQVKAAISQALFFERTAHLTDVDGGRRLA